MSRDRNDKAKNFRRRELMIDGVPHQLRAALVSAARDNHISVNEQAVRVLAAHYKVKLATPENGLRGQTGPSPHIERKPDTEKLSIRGPAALHRKMAVDAAKRDGTLRGVVLEQLSLWANMTPEPIGRRPRTGRTA
jgi:predicted HicB family RNase H-like nuclease